MYIENYEASLVPVALTQFKNKYNQPDENE